MQESVLTWHGVVGFMYPGRDPARGRTVAQGIAAPQGSPVAQKSHGALRLSVRSPMLCPKHHQREETCARAAIREIAWPFDGRAAVRRPTHQTVVESPSRGRRYGPGSRWGEWYLRKFEVGCAKPHVMAKILTRY